MKRNLIVDVDADATPDLDQICSCSVFFTVYLPLNGNVIGDALEYRVESMHGIGLASVTLCF